jgi:predicted amidohydrolase YtcJ
MAGSASELRSGGRHAEAVGVLNGQIAAVGSASDLEAMAGPSTRRIALDGRFVLPGFEDAHAHIWKMGHLLTTMVDLRRTSSLGEMEGLLRERAASLPPGAWLQGRGFNEAKLAERRRPTRAELDRVAGDRPVVLTRACGHIYSCNTAALQAAGITAASRSPAGGLIERDERGDPNGLLHETAMGLMQNVMPAPTPTELEAMIAAALEHQLALGITATSDCGVRLELLDVYRSMEARGKLRARVNVMPLGKPDNGREVGLSLPGVHRGEFLQADTVKYLADGGLSGATAALSMDYIGSAAGSRGILRFSTEELLARCEAAEAAGWRVAIHAIGDVTLDQVLGIYEQLRGRGGTMRHRIEHFGLPTPEMIYRAARAGVLTAPQTIFLWELGGNFLDVLPGSMLPRTYPVRAMLDAGVAVALSSDAPVVEDDNPLRGMAAAVLRTARTGETIAMEQAITIGEALYGYTLGGAIVAGAAATRGSIEAGKMADMVVLSDDPLAAEPESLHNVRVEMTLVGGEIRYEA